MHALNLKYCANVHSIISEDFRLTACMALLKWVLKMCRQRKKRSHLQRQNTGYEEMISTKEISDSKPKYESMFQSETTTNIVHETVDQNDNETDITVLENKCNGDVDNDNCDIKETAIDKESLSGENGAQQETTATAMINNHDNQDSEASDADDKTEETLGIKTTTEDAGVKDNDNTDDEVNQDQYQDKINDIKDEKDDSDYKDSKVETKINDIKEEKDKDNKDNKVENKRNVKEEKDEVDDNDTTDDEFADLVPNEGNYRGSSRTDLQYDDLPGEDESPTQAEQDKGKKVADGENRCKYIYIATSCM